MYIFFIYMCMYICIYIGALVARGRIDAEEGSLHQPPRTLHHQGTAGKSTRSVVKRGGDGWYTVLMRVWCKKMLKSYPIWFIPGRTAHLLPSEEATPLQVSRTFTAGP